jgi:YidC/Oxa1 family membrane protein insertase
MQLRLVLVFALTFAVILISEPLVKKYTGQNQPAPQQQQQPAQQAQPAPAAQAPGTAAAAEKVTSKPAAPTAPSGTVAATGESETVIENDLYKITFTNKGAQVKSWILKKYDDEQRHPLDLVDKTAAQQFGYPMSLWTYDEALNQQLAGALYVASASGEQKAPTSLTFEYAQGDLAVKKTFTFDHTYVVKVETLVTRNGQPVQAFPAWPSAFGDMIGPIGYASQRIDYQNGGKITRLEPKKISGGGTSLGPFRWAAVLDQYFAAVFLPDQPDQAVMVTLHNAAKIPKNPIEPNPNELVEAPVLGVAVGNAAGPTSERIFVGPKSLDVLKTIHARPTKQEAAAGLTTGPNLEDVVDFGFFSFFGKPLFLWLKWTHDHWVKSWPGAWGWSILILTVIINFALFPLKMSSMKSALKMQKLAPQMKAVQEKYRKYPMRDPRRAQQNQEIAALYKKEGVNPLGGCFPMLIQLPFLWAFYTMLGVAIELRHAPWFWIHDLSSADPLHILPIGIFVTMFLLQRMMPQAGMDAMQQKMMMVMMPVMIAVISWALAAGLCLYWTAGNIISIGQQVWINNTKFGREMREAAAKRAAKKSQK